MLPICGATIERARISAPRRRCRPQRTEIRVANGEVQDAPPSEVSSSRCPSRRAIAVAFASLPPREIHPLWRTRTSSIYAADAAAPESPGPLYRRFRGKRRRRCPLDSRQGHGAPSLTVSFANVPNEFIPVYQWTADSLVGPRPSRGSMTSVRAFREPISGRIRRASSTAGWGQILGVLRTARVGRGTFGIDGRSTRGCARDGRPPGDWAALPGSSAPDRARNLPRPLSSRNLRESEATLSHRRAIACRRAAGR